LAAIQPQDIVLVVGAATGYGAAVVSRLASSVVALEEDAALAARAGTNLEALSVENVAVVTGPLAAGYAKEAPYDVILIDGAVETVPTALTDQLRDQGRLIAIVGAGRAADAMIYQKTGTEVSGRSAFNAAARPLPGFAKPKAFVF
jgi:protein-L-isoaspartate(D-aspartate) O-methyltransferase